MKSVAYACFAGALVVVLVWVATGMHFATRTELPPEEHLSCTATTECGEDNVCKDGKCYDDFGDKVAGTEWRSGFQLGIIDGAGPAGGGLVGLGILLLFLERRKGQADISA